MRVGRALIAAAFCAAACLRAAPAAAAMPAAPVSPAAAEAPALDNPIVVENRQPGSFGWMHGPSVSDDATGQIKGYWSAASAKAGDTITLYVTVNPAQTFTLDLYRLGWYGGAGGRLRLHAGALTGQQQPPCTPDATTGLIACGWAPTYALTIPSDWTSGVYLGMLTNAQGYQNYVIFVVRDDRPAPFLYQQNIMTDQAYNNYPDDGATGKSLYTYNSFGANTMSGESRAVKVSFDRPYADYGFMQIDQIEFIRWIERSGYDVTYSTNVDTHANGASLRDHKAVLDVGHDEYWSKEIRDAMESARDAGVNLAFFAADTASVQVRVEASAAGIANRVIVCYKNAALDPAYGSTTTVAFRDAPVNRPEQALRGVISGAMVNPGTPNSDYIVTNSSHWIYSGTGFKDGDRVGGIVGYEMDRYRAEYPAPSSNNWTLLSHSPFVDYLGRQDYANSSIYQAPSGAWVFSSGTISWSRALDGFWYGRTDARIQKTTDNLFNAFLFGAPVVHDLKLTAPDTVKPQTTFSVGVTAENAQGNPVSSYNGTVHFSSSDTSSGVQLPADATLAGGQGTFSVRLAAGGPQTIIVSDSANALSSSVTVTVDAPTGIAFRGATRNDQGEDGSSFAATDPAGWTLVAEAVNVDNGRTRLLRRFAANEPAGYTWRFGAANHVGGAIVAYAGVDRTTPEDAAPGTQVGSGASPTTPSRSTATNGAWLVSLYGTAGWGGSTSTAPAGMNMRATFGANHSFGFADQAIAIAGATGSRTWTTSYATPWAAMAFALRPAGATPTASAFRLTAPASVTAGAAFTVAVAAVDAQGNTVGSYGGTIHITASDTSPDVVLPPDTTLVAGQGSFSATLRSLGPQTITATDAAASMTGAVTLSVTSGGGSLDVAAPASSIAGRPFTITIRALDASGNVASAYNGTIHFATTDASPSAVLPADSTLNNGTGTFSVTLATAASSSVTVSDQANQLSGSATIAVGAAPASRLALSTASTPSAGTSFAFAATAQDAYGNTDAAYAGKVHFTTSDTSAGVVLPADLSMSNGRGTFSATLIRAGSQTITAADVAASTIVGTLTVTVRPASATHLALTTTTPTPIAGVGFSFAVTALDQYGNTDDAYAGRAHFTSTDTSAGVALPSDSALANGQGSFSATLTRSGAQTITAADSITPTVKGTLAITLQAAAAATLTLAAPASARAGESMALRVTLTDQFGNIAAGYRGTVHFTTSDALPTVSLPADYTFVSGDAGVHSFSATLWSPSNQTITVRDTVNAGLRDTRSVAISLL